MVENIYRELAERRGTDYDLHEVILHAARDVDRPIFYSVAVIIAGYLPIYALTGPSGKLFHPMADTMAFALVGALIFTLTFVPVIVVLLVQERRQRKAAIKSSTGSATDTPGVSTGASTIRKVTLVVCTLIFGGDASPGPADRRRIPAAPRRRRALGPRHACPTPSVSKTPRSSPRKIRNILIAYPQVTVVGSELGRPDDGTDPTGFFNCEFYVGLKPYDDKSWSSGSIHTKAELTRDLEKKLSAYPGVIFNFTQPAEDAVDEALTGLKSALAVKIFGPDLDVLEKKAVEIKTTLDKTPGFTELTVVRELGQPSLLIDIDRPKIARYGINVSDVEAVIETAIGGSGRHPSHPGRKTIRSRRAHGAAIPLQRRANLQPARSRARRPADSALRTRHHQGIHRRILHLSRK